MYCFGRLLSSAYVTETTNPDLELRVTVLNVNHGHNIKLLENCPILDEYAQYVEKVRGLASQPGMTLDQAVEKESELKVLEEWFELAVEANSIEEFQAKYWVEK